MTNGRWTLFQWPPGDRVTPLYWYSSQPPQFLIPKEVGEYDGVNRRFPIEYYRGESQSALYDLESDYAQRHNLIDAETATRAELRRGLIDFLDGIHAPMEIRDRLEL